VESDIGIVIFLIGTVIIVIIILYQDGESGICHERSVIILEGTTYLPVNVAIGRSDDGRL